MILVRPRPDGGLEYRRAQDCGEGDRTWRPLGERGEADTPGQGDPDRPDPVLVVVPEELTWGPRRWPVRLLRRGGLRWLAGIGRLMEGAVLSWTVPLWQKRARAPIGSPVLIGVPALPAGVLAALAVAAVLGVASQGVSARALKSARLEHGRLLEEITGASRRHEALSGAGLRQQQRRSDRLFPGSGQGWSSWLASALARSAGGGLETAGIQLQWEPPHQAGATVSPAAVLWRLEVGRQVAARLPEVVRQLESAGLELEQVAVEPAPEEGSRLVISGRISR